MPQDEAVLQNEARYLHRAFFGCEAPPELTARYVAANRLCCPESDAVAEKTLLLKLDPEAVEFALRVHRKPSVLSKKIRILFYLAESQSAYYAWFMSPRQSLPAALAAIMGSFLRAAAKLATGEYLIRRHRLV